MMLDYCGTELAVLVALCVLMVFFLPAVHGPYSVIHCPATTLQVLSAAAQLRVTITQALGAALHHLIFELMLLSLPWVSVPASGSAMPADRILRC
jgi:hypothetical protein